VTSIQVRPAQLADVGRLVELLQLGALEASKDTTYDLSAYERALTEINESNRGVVLVADRDGLVVAMCQLIIFRHFQIGGGLCAEVESVHVHPSLRGQGLGSILMRAALDYARDAGCYRVQLTSNVRRLDAHRFYERLGFEASRVGFEVVLASD
jgi:GNAT superfamily N-acetyltransferase